VYGKRCVRAQNTERKPRRLAYQLAPFPPSGAATASATVSATGGLPRGAAGLASECVDAVAEYTAGRDPLFAYAPITWSLGLLETVAENSLAVYRV